MKKFKLVDYNDYIDDWSLYEPLTAKEAIVAYCHQCCCYQPSEVKQCPAKGCPLWLLRDKWYRTPKRSNMSEDQRAARAARASKMRASRIAYLAKNKNVS